MKRVTINLMVVAIMSLASLGAFAQGKNLNERVTFRGTMWVNSTSVEPGQYVVKYDAQTGEMTILDRNKVIVTAKATVKTSEKSFADGVILTSATPGGRKLTGIRLAGQREEIFITDLTAEMDKPISN